MEDHRDEDAIEFLVAPYDLKWAVSLVSTDGRKVSDDPLHVGNEVTL